MVTFDFFREGITASLVELGTKEVLVRETKTKDQGHPHQRG